MKKYGGDLTDYGRTGSLYGKDIEATYKRPKNQIEMQDTDINLNDMTYEQIMALVPENWHDEKSDYWDDTPPVPFSCKDGQTNAYVKRGTDEEVDEYMNREETKVLVWHIATDDNHIRLMSGGKIRAKGIDWFVVKVIQQDSTGSYANRYKSMDTNPDNEELRHLGLKTMMCIGGTS